MRETDSKIDFPGFIPQVQSLRGLAVLLVIFCHLDFWMFQAGFIGVDIFFVISGFLITIQLVHIRVRYVEFKIQETKRFLGEFYLRRIFRILPPALVTIALTVIFSKIYLSVSRANEITQDSLYSLAFIANLRFMFTATDYFFQNTLTSPLLHFWSLSIEEQFYLFFPLAFLLLSLSLQKSDKFVIRNLKIFQMNSIWLILILVTLAFAYRNSAYSYFNPFFRFYELLMGALAAVIFLDGNRKFKKSLRRLFSIYGMVAIFLSLVVIDGNQYPGIKALLPTSATFALILSLKGRNGSNNNRFNWVSLLGVKLGNISYSLYLLHFPMINFAKMYFSNFNESIYFRFVFLFLIFLLSSLMYLGIEKPIHEYGKRFCKTLFENKQIKGNLRKRLVGRASIASLFTLLALFVSFLFPSKDNLKSISPGIIYKNSGSNFIYPYDDSVFRGEFNYSLWQKKIEIGNNLSKVPESIDIPLTEIWPGRKRQWENCMDAPEDRVTCSFGNLSAKRTVVILGDSYALSLIPMVLNSFDLSQWRILALNERECMIANVTPLLDNGDRLESCNRHRNWVFQYLSRIKPDVAILSDQAFHNISIDKSLVKLSPFEIWESGLDDSLKRISKNVGSFVYVSTPSNAAALPDCSLADGKLLPTCFSLNSKWEEIRFIQDKLTTKNNGYYFDVTRFYCADGKCPPIIDNSPVFWDGLHFSETFSMKLAKPFRGFLKNNNILAVRY